MVCLDDYKAFTVGDATVFAGSNLDVLPFMADNSVDSIVTDPPYELGFMGKSWDSSGIAYSVELWQECLRVLKPGGHILAFGGSRTWHRLAVAIEDAGFELRDSIAWLYGSGFPKSLNISKAIDKDAGAERDEWPTLPMQEKGEVGEISKNRRCAICLKALASGNPCQCDRTSTAITSDAKKWDGWGTALKPAFEPIVVGRKPLVGTVAANVLAYGTGGLNIDASRIKMSTEDEKNSANNWKPQGYELKDNIYEIGSKVIATEQNNQGRWPANIILDEFTASLLDEQSGVTKSQAGGRSTGRNFGQDYDNDFSTDRARTGHSDSGGASRFFYVAKASKRDRNEGLDDQPQKASSNYGSIQERSSNPVKANFHPTVKPTELMRYLIKLVTPANGIVLDPFTGSGSTGKAALLDGYQFIGIELTTDYLPIIEGRLTHAYNTTTEQDNNQTETLF